MYPVGLFPEFFQYYHWIDSHVDAEVQVETRVSFVCLFRFAQMGVICVDVCPQGVVSGKAVIVTDMGVRRVVSLETDVLDYALCVE